MNLHNLHRYIPSWLCGNGDCYPYPTHSHPYPTRLDDIWDIPLADQPPAPLPMRILPLSLTNRDYRTAQDIHAFLLQAPPRKSPDLTADITAAFSLPPEDYTPRLAEYLVLAVEATVEVDAFDKRRHGQGFVDAYWVAKAAAREGLIRANVWSVVESEWEESRKYASEPARVVKTLLALAILARLAPGFVHVLGFEKNGTADGEKPVFPIIFLLFCVGFGGLLL